MKRQAVLIVVVIAISSLGFFGSRASAGGGGGCSDPVRTKRRTEVHIKWWCFRPAVTIVDKGDEVTWLNRDGEKHNVALVNFRWVSKSVGLKDTVSYRFDRPGV